MPSLDRVFAGTASESVEREKLLEEYHSLSELLSVDQEKAPKTVDAMYLHAWPESMVEVFQLLDRAAELYHSGLTKTIFYNGSDGSTHRNSQAGSAWAGGDWYVEELVKRGVPLDALIATGSEGFHTRAETDELAECMKEQDLKTVMMVTVPHHTVRSLSCLIGSMVKTDHIFAVYYANLDPVDSETAIQGSQGKWHRNLSEAVDAEIERTLYGWIRGMEKGGEAWHGNWSAPPEIVREYLEERDRQAKEAGLL